MNFGLLDSAAATIIPPMTRRAYIHRFRWTAVLLTTLLLPACSTSKFAVGKVMVPVLDNARNAAMASNDIRTFEDGAAANLFLLEGLIETDPKNRDLRINAAMLYFSYAFSVAEDSDPDYAGLLYVKGRDHALAALSGNKKFPQRLDMAFDQFAPGVDHLRKKDVPAAVWLAANWSQYIALHLHETKVLRDVSKVARVLDKVVELDPAYFEGLPHVMAGTLHAFKPPIMGGNPEASLASFAAARAKRSPGQAFLLTELFYAKYYTYRVQDADDFTATLQSVINADVAASDPYQLLNLIAQRKAQALLGELDELF